MSTFLPFVSAGLTIAGTIGQMTGAKAGGGAMREVEEYNASVLRQGADLIRTSGEFDIVRQRRQAQAFKARQRALYAKAGVLLEGSPLYVITDSAAEAELDIQVTRYNTEIEASRAESEARYHEYLGREYKREGQAKAGSILLANTADFVTKYGGLLLPRKIKPLNKET